VQVQQAPPDLATSLDQQGPGLGTTNAIDIDRAAGLKGLEGITRRAGERSVRRPGFVSECCETTL
jgi:hypothetical protein